MSALLTCSAQTRTTAVMHGRFAFIVQRSEEKSCSFVRNLVVLFCFVLLFCFFVFLLLLVFFVSLLACLPACLFFRLFVCLFV